eukprot:823211-Prymnesium_polylepis.1
MAHGAWTWTWTWTWTWRNTDGVHPACPPRCSPLRAQASRAGREVALGVRRAGGRRRDRRAGAGRRDDEAQGGVCTRTPCVGPLVCRAREHGLHPLRASEQCPNPSVPRAEAPSRASDPQPLRASHQRPSAHVPHRLPTSAPRLTFTQASHQRPSAH